MKMFKKSPTSNARAAIFKDASTESSLKIS